MKIIGTIEEIKKFEDTLTDITMHCDADMPCKDCIFNDSKCGNVTTNINIEVEYIGE